MACVKRSAIFLVTAFCSATVSAQTSDRSSEILKIVASATAEICGDVPTGGWDAGAHVGASLDASLKGFFKKLVDAKVVGSVGAGGGAYAGPLRTELAKVRADTRVGRDSCISRQNDPKAMIQKGISDQDRILRRHAARIRIRSPSASASPITGQERY